MVWLTLSVDSLRTENHCRGLMAGVEEGGLDVMADGKDVAVGVFKPCDLVSGW